MCDVVTVLATVENGLYSDGSRWIPLGSVSHIEQRKFGIVVVMHTSTWSTEADDYNNGCYIENDKADHFIEAFTAYVSEEHALRNP